MELEKQVCSLELAKRLKELGVKQESQYEWLLPPYEGLDFVGGKNRTHNVAAAFTVAELGEMLPVRLFIEGMKVHENGYTEFQTKKLHGSWKCLYLNSVGASYSNEAADLYDGTTVTADTEADARAKMLVYLTENNLLAA
jgi:hypothetical protein